MDRETLDEIWKGDQLNRKEDGVYLQRFIENAYRMDLSHQSSFVLNINSEWGSGKTWFLERFAKQLKVNHPVVYFDAWKNDFTKDPLTSLIAVICESLEEQFPDSSKAKQKVDLVKKSALKFIKPSLPVVLAALVKHYSGIALLEETEESDNDIETINSVSLVQDVSTSLTKIAASEAMNNFYKQKKGIDEFMDAIKSLVAHLGSLKRREYLPICIFIDELDRCRPTYAIELLEAVKHIFSIGGLFFIIATDSKQLAHSINAVYGNKFNSAAYLKRFFYTEYSLSEVNYEKMAQHLLSGFSFEDKVYLPPSYAKKIGFDGYFSKNAKFFQLTPREQEQVFVNFKNCVLSTDFHKIHYAYILFLLSLKLKNEDVYLSLINNDNSKEFSEFMSSKGSKATFVGLSSDRNFQHKQLENPKDLNVTEIINFYSKIKRKSYKELGSESTSYIFQSEIIDELSAEKSLRVGLVNGYPTLYHYFSLITQAGRLISMV